RRIAVYVAGPAAQLVLAGAAWALQQLFEPSRSLEIGTQSAVARALNLLFWVNVGWPLFNLIPVPPLDGAQILLEVIRWSRAGDPPPWEQDANWWRGGTSMAEWRHSPEAEQPSLFRMLVPWVVGGLVVALVIWWGYDANRSRQRHEAFVKLRQFGGVFGW